MENRLALVCHVFCARYGGMRSESCGMVEAVSFSKEGKSYDIRFQERPRGSAPPRKTLSNRHSGDQTGCGPPFFTRVTNLLYSCAPHVFPGCVVHNRGEHLGGGVVQYLINPDRFTRPLIGASSLAPVDPRPCTHRVPSFPSR